MVATPARLHASTRRGKPLTTDAATGEVRVPIVLYALDDPCGDIDLVLSRAEGQRLFTQLAQALGLVHPVAAPSGPGAVQ